MLKNELCKNISMKTGLRWLISFVLLSATAVQAGLKDNTYEGNIFVIYGGNGEIIPPRKTLEESLQRKQAVMLIFYVNDSKDCKVYTPIITRLQVEFNREVNFIALNVDALTDLNNSQAAKYFTGKVPHTVLFDKQGKKIYEFSGTKTYLQLKPYLTQMVKSGPMAPH